MPQTPPAATPTPAAVAGLPRFFINRDFALLLGGQFISVIGDFTFATTLILWVATLIARGQPWAPLAVSGVLLASILPDLLVGPLAGVFADRWDKRRTMLRMDAARAILIALLVLATGAVPLPFVPGGRLPLLWQLGAIYGVVFLAGACAQLFNPSIFALLAAIVEEPDRARASGLNQGASSFAAVLGPALAALLFFGAGIHWALLLNALSFVVSFLAVLAMRARGESRSEALGESGEADAPAGFLRELGDGLRFYAGNRILVTLLVAGVLALLGFGTLNTLGIFFVTENLHASAGVYGILASVQGVGLIVGAVLAGLFAQRVGVARILGGSLVAWGVVVLVYARQTSLVPAFALMGLTGVLLSAAQVAETPLLMHATPREYLGRVAAVFGPAISISELLGIGISGYLASTGLRGFHARVLGLAIGPIDSIFTVVGISILAGGVYALVNLRGVRLAERPPRAVDTEG